MNEPGGKALEQRNSRPGILAMIGAAGIILILADARRGDRGGV
jgi:hypothetical protein